MPELPEVEILVRHLAPLLRNRIIGRVEVKREKVIAPTSRRLFSRSLRGAQFISLIRRGKFLLFTLRSRRRGELFRLTGHLGMTGRMYLLPVVDPDPKHAAVVLSLGAVKFMYEDTRYFGRLTLETKVTDHLGPEPLGREFTVVRLTTGLKRSAQPVKVRLLDQSLLAGIGNIYASEALFLAGISPYLASCRLKASQILRLRQAVRRVLREAIQHGSTVPLDWNGKGPRDGLFYYGRSAATPDNHQEHLRVYGREGEACERCGEPIKRIVQSARSTYFCPHCQATA